MIRYLKHSEINPEKWNQAVHNSLFSTIFVEYEMLDLLTGSDTWDALVQGNYEAVMPLPYRKKGVLKYVYTPFFMPQMGILSEKELLTNDIQDFLSEASKHFVLADLLLNEKVVFQKQYDICFVSYILQLQHAYSELYSQFHDNTKRNIKAGEKTQCRVTIGEEQVSKIIEMFRNNRGQMGSVHYHDRDYQILENVANYLLNRNLLDLYGVRTPEGKLAAGALFVKDGKRRWFWFSGRDNALSNSKPMFILLNSYIRDHAESEFVLDFNGSTNPNVARLYQSFGSQRYDIPFVRCYKNKIWKIMLSPFI